MSSKYLISQGSENQDRASPYDDFNGNMQPVTYKLKTGLDSARNQTISVGFRKDQMTDFSSERFRSKPPSNAH